MVIEIKIKFKGNIMARTSEKQKLIDKYPQLKSEIEAMWDDKSMWARTYTDDTGTPCIQWEKDVVIDVSFKSMIIEMELESEIEKLQEDISLYVTDGAYGGLGILKSEFAELEKLSCESHGIYGD